MGRGDPAQLECRFCNAPLGDAVLDLGLSPLSNALVDESHLAQADELYPLRAYVCRRCWLMQVPSVVSRERIFSDYAYFSSYSSTWLEHVRRYADAAVARFGLAKGHLVVEIASNDGHLLRCFQERGIPVLGVEPARNVAAQAVSDGVPTLTEFFGIDVARDLRAQGKGADLIVCNNVFAHVPDVNDFAAGLAALLKPGGTITIEFPHVLRTLEGGEFDTIYHEHYSYFSLATASRVLEAHELVVCDVEELPTHGGSLRLYVRHRGQREPSNRVRAVLAAENAAGLESIEPYAALGRKARAVKQDLNDFLRRAANEGKRVAGYGAPAKATTLLNYARVGPEALPFTVDRSPHKQGKYIPGVRIPIHAPERIEKTRPDFVLILPWNIKEEIEEQMAGIRAWGGRFAVPIPRLETL
jgi:SAM-dependent methyltransferase